MSKKSTPSKKWRELIADYNEDALFIGTKKETFYDAAITGIGRVHGSQYVLVYSYHLIVVALAAKMWARKDYETKEDCWESAQEWTDFNTVGAYMGPNTPFITMVDEHGYEYAS